MLFRQALVGEKQWNPAIVSLVRLGENISPPAKYVRLRVCVGEYLVAAILS